MAVQTFETRAQDPADVLDYKIDWRPGTVPAGLEAFLAADEVITTSTWAAYTDKWLAADDFDVVSDSHTDTTTTVWVSGGVAGKKYYITNHITTDAGRQKDRSIKIECKEQ